MKLSEVAKEVIRLAEAKREYWDTELPKRHPDYPIVRDGEDSGPPPPEEAQLNKLLTSLPDDTIYKLILVMDIGRGFIGTQNLAEQFEQVKEDFAQPEEAVSLMMENVPLADELTDGLAKLRECGVDVDKLRFKVAKPRK
jgi:hypothetical protein